MRPVLLRTVIATTDLDDASLVALEVAHRLMAIAGAKLHIVHVSANQPSTETPTDEAAANAVIEQLNGILRKARVSPDDVQTHIIPGPPAETIRAAAERLKADVIVLGSHRHRQGANGPLGSTALAVVTESAIPCLVVSDAPLRLPLENIVVPIDGSETARGALVVGLSWASALRKPVAPDAKPKTTLIGVHIADHPSGEEPDRGSINEALDFARENAGRWAGVAISGEVIAKPDVAGAIVEHAEKKKADLVVLGTRGDAQEARELGSVSTKVLQSLKMPVLLVSHGVWRSYAEPD